MATYKFEQFKVEITNPTVSANEDTIQLQVSKSTIAVDVLLETKDAKFGLLLDDIQVENLNYEGYDNLMVRVNERLKDFEI
mgnify:FL=1|tara:strand:- start:3324 stop:3566 length:243 start_codon:yes stop_codon:yes gene_type:complete